MEKGEEKEVIVDDNDNFVKMNIAKFSWNHIMIKISHEVGTSVSRGATELRLSVAHTY